MPIPRDHDQWPLKAYHHDEQDPLPPFEAVIMRKMSEESIRTEDCEGPVPDPSVEDMEDQGRGIMPENEGEILCSDRTELIERIKRGESPTWVPSQAVSGLDRSITFQRR